MDLFFVLSGFLIGGILLDHRDSKNYFSIFYLRRACRIFPLYYLMVAVFAVGVAAGIGAHGGAMSWLFFEEPLPLWSYLLYLQNFSMTAASSHGPNWLAPTWSLAVEEQFYLLLPLMVRYVAPRRLPWLLVALVASAPLVRTGLFLMYPNGGFAGYVLLAGRWDALFLGVLGALAVRDARTHEWLAKHGPVLRACFWVSTTISAILLARSQGIGSLGMSTIGHTALAIMALSLILLAAVAADAWESRVLRSRVLIWLGGVSYGIYLLHQPVSGSVHALMYGHAPRIASFSEAGATLLALALTLVLAHLSWRYFERPFVLAGHRVGYRA